MNEMTTYTMVKSMAASSIFACAPEFLIKKHEAAIYEGAIDDWASAVMLLREWADYTRNLEQRVDSLRMEVFMLKDNQLDTVKDDKNAQLP